MTSRKASFASFGSLSQVIHQLDQRFVVITYTNDASSDPLRENLPPVEGVEDPEEGERCTFFEVGEIGGTNRWWRGIWTAEDVQKAVGSELPSVDIVEKASESFKDGWVSMGGLGATESQLQSLNLTRASSQSQDIFTTQPFLRIDSKEGGTIVKIHLESLSPTQAPSRATEVLFAIASEISSNQSSRLFPSSSRDSLTHSPQSRSSTSPVRLSGYAKEEVTKAQKRALDLEKQVKYLVEELKKHEKEETLPLPVMTPGRSLGNPIRKPRRIQAVEFDDGSDEESPRKKRKRKP